MDKSDQLIDTLTCGKGSCDCRRATIGKGNVHCPAHDDKNPSLSVAEKSRKLLLKCHAGCSQDAVVEKLREQGLWPESRRDRDRSNQGTKGKETR